LLILLWHKEISLQMWIVYTHKMLVQISNKRCEETVQLS